MEEVTTAWMEGRSRDKLPEPPHRQYYIEAEERSSVIVVNNQGVIDAAQNELSKRLEQAGTFMGKKVIGFQGGYEVAPLYWFEEYGLWWAYLMGGKHWNAFGVAGSERVVDDPDQKTITCEINFPIDDPGSRIAGGFVREGKDRLYVVHSGRVGGGRLGIGPEAFKAYATAKLDWWPCGWYNGDVVKIALISLLDAEDLVANIAEFVVVVDEFKRTVA